MDSHTREPIISVLGHVDSGKTTLLDRIRGSVVASREAGGITQHIGATDVPFEAIKRVCGPLLENLKIKVSVRGLLFIDTPGHAAFTTLRKRGGSVADLAVLVVDLNDGLMPQTIEALNILKQYKTPFIVAANKADLIAGWIPSRKVSEQPKRAQDEFYKKFYTLVGQLSEHGIESELYSSVSDFSRQVAIVPTVAEKGEGVAEVLMMLVGLAQQYLAKQLSVDVSGPGRGTILEVKEETGLGTTVDVILYDGVIRRGDPLVLGGKRGVITSKVKALLKPKALDELRDPREKFRNVTQVYAAAGVKIAAPGLEDALAGSPIYVGGRELVERVRREMGDVEYEGEQVGVIVKADTLGSLEALLNILREQRIPVRRASIGGVSKQDVVEAQSIGGQDKYLGVILAFNSVTLPEADSMASDQGVAIISGNVIYRLIEDYCGWKKRLRRESKKALEAEVTSPAKFRLLPKHTFRASKPAVVGVEVLAGKLRKGCRVMRSDGRVVGYLKGMQAEGEEISEAPAGEKVAVSIDNVTVGRQLSEGDTCYSYISPQEFEKLKSSELSAGDEQILKELRDIRLHKNE